jgi:hypothetical protein
MPLHVAWNLKSRTISRMGNNSGQVKNSTVGQTAKIRRLTKVNRTRRNCLKRLSGFRPHRRCPSRLPESNERVSRYFRIQWPPASLNAASEVISVVGQYVNSDYDVARCAHKLLCSALFKNHGDYIRKQILHCLLQVSRRTFPPATPYPLGSRSLADAVH